MQLNPLQLLAQGIYVEAATPQADLTRLIDSLHPVKTKYALRRIGGVNDGGYLLPDDLNGLQACFSPGVADNASFEADLLQKTGVQSHLADYSVEGPPQGFVPKSFRKKFLGCVNDAVFMTLDAWVAEMEGATADSDFLLQMDIEGAEYSTLLSCPEDTLKRFRLIVLEVHNVYAWGQRNFFGMVDDVFKKLLQHFHVAHNHVNTNDGLVDVGGTPVPRTFELTLYRKDRSPAIGYRTAFPHPLDASNVPGRDDLPLPARWYRASDATPQERLLLCRPHGGINDILCSIERCWSYAEKFNREMVIDTRISGIKDDFWRYFAPAGDDAQIRFQADFDHLDALGAFPAALNGRISELRTDYSFAKGGFVDVASDELVTFDPEQDYADELLVHEQGWLGGRLTSPLMLRKLRLTERARQDIRSRLATLPAEYVGVHIRHTDYTSDYRAFIAEIKDRVSGKHVLICSDSSEVIDYVTGELADSKVIRLSTFDNYSTERLHYRDMGESQYAANIETLTDLFALSLGDALLFGNVREANRPSGFSLLAQSLHADKAVARNLIGAAA